MAKLNLKDTAITVKAALVPKKILALTFRVLAGISITIVAVGASAFTFI